MSNVTSMYLIFLWTYGRPCAFVNPLHKASPIDKIAVKDADSQAFVAGGVRGVLNTPAKNESMCIVYP